MILVTGANGMVGSYVEKVFSNEKLILTDLPDIDITNKDSFFRCVEKNRPDYILHLASETDVDKCEIEIDHAYKINTIGTQNVALACQKFNSIMIYISTGYVFNGKGKQLHTEFDKPDPINVYGKSKYQGELIVKDLLNKYYIFRAEWMIGGGPKKDKKFVGKIIELCKSKKEIDVIDDVYSTPTFAMDFVSGIKELISTGNFGLYHLANKGICSRYELALEIIKNLKADLEINPVSSDKFPQIAPRSKSTAIRNYKLELMGMDLMPEWKGSLKKYCRLWYNVQ